MTLEDRLSDLLTPLGFTPRHASPFSSCHLEHNLAGSTVDVILVDGRGAVCELIFDSEYLTGRQINVPLELSEEGLVESVEKAVKSLMHSAGANSWLSEMLTED